MRAVRTVGLAAGVVLAVMVTAGPVSGQSATDDARPLGPPVRLTPSQDPVREPRMPPETFGREDGRPLPGAVEARVLPDPDTEAAGVLLGEGGGFGMDMWVGTPRALVERLLPVLPVSAPSRTMQDLARRLLAGVARPPDGERRLDLLAVRVTGLAALGAGDDVEDLVATVPALLDDETTARTVVDSRLLTGRPNCADAPGFVARFSDPFWPAFLIYCQLAAGQTERARLGLELMRDQGEVDPVLTQVVRIMADGEAPASPADLDDPTPLRLASLHLAGMSLPESVLAAADPASLVSIVDHPGTDPVIAAGAAEKAVAMGLVGPERLARAYASVPFDPAELASALPQAGSIGGPEGPRRRALLHQALAAETDRAARARLLRLAVKAAPPGTIDVVLPHLDAVSPSPDLAALAPAAAIAYYAAGRPVAAKGWHDLATATDDDPSVRLDARWLWPLSILADGAPPAGLSFGLDAWLDVALTAEPGENLTALRSRAATFLGLMAALDERVPEQAWTRVADRPVGPAAATPSPALLRGIGIAAAGNRTAETVLLGLVAIGDAGPVGAPAQTVAAVVSGLRMVGLPTEARALAVEAAVASADLGGG